MKIPLDWLKEYVEVHKTNREVAEAFTLLGLLLDKPIENVKGMEVLDLEHRMDRSDWLSILGCARDLAAFEGLALKHPKLYTQDGHTLPDDEKIALEIHAKDFVKRYNTKVFKNITVKESPEWLKARLEAYGIPARNNIVDITNYVMVEYGQPLHAHDLAKMHNKKIEFRYAKQGEKITTLLGDTLELDERTVVISDGEQLTGIAGIVGGDSIRIAETTKDILLDSGSYDQTLVRQTSRRLKIQNETVLRYDKFLHPYANELAIQRATELILELAGGEYYENVDYYPEPVGLKVMTMRVSRLLQLSGIELDVRRAQEILKALEYEVTEVSDEDITVTVPYFRTDVEVEDDIVADVLRINGYQNIPTTPISAAPPKEITPDVYNFENKLRNIMISLGAHEHITDPLTTATTNPQQIVLENALTSEKAALRTSLDVNLRPVLNNYKKHKITNISIFEIGKTYYQERQEYFERRQLHFIYSSEAEDYKTQNKHVKSVLMAVLQNLGTDTHKVSFKKPTPESDFAQICYNSELLGAIMLDAFTLNTETLQKIANEVPRTTNILGNYSTEDITYEVEVTEDFGARFTQILNTPGVRSAYVTKDIYHNESTADKKFITVTVIFEQGVAPEEVKSVLHNL